MHNQGDAELTSSVLDLLAITFQAALVLRERDDTPASERLLERAACATLDAGLLTLVIAVLSYASSPPHTKPKTDAQTTLMMLTMVFVSRQVRVVALEMILE